MVKYFIIYLLCFFIIANECFAQLNNNCAIKSYQHLQWEYAGPFGDSGTITNQNFGAIASICAHSTNDSMDIYIGALSGGLFHTIDGGKHWQNLTDVLEKNVSGVIDIIVDFKSKNRKIKIATGMGYSWIENEQAGVLASDDGGNSWMVAKFKRESGEYFLPTINKLIQDQSQPNNFYASAEGAIWRSIDDCKNFEKIFPITKEHLKLFNRAPQNKLNSIVLDEVRQILYFASTQEIMYTNGVGKRYEPCIYYLTNLLNEAQDVTAIEITKNIDQFNAKEPNAFCNGVLLKICNANQNIMHVYKTYENSAQPYSIINIQLSNPDSAQLLKTTFASEDISAQYYNGLRCNFLSEKIHYLAGWTLHKSVDTLKTFKPLYNYSFGEFNVPHTDIRSYIITKSSENGTNDHILLGTDGGLSFSNNGGKSFRNMNGLQLPITQFYGVGVSAFDGKISAGAQDNSIMTYLPAENKWLVRINGDGYDVEYSTKNIGEVFGEYNSQILQKGINGEVPFYNNSRLSHDGENNPSKNLKCLPSGNFYFGGGKFIHKKMANDTKWISTTALTGIENFIFSYDVCTTNENIIYASNIWQSKEHQLYKSNDGGKSWQDITANIKVDTPHAMQAQNYRIMKIYCSPNNENDVWLGLGFMSDYNNNCNGYNRIIHSKNGGQTWQDESKGLPANGVTDILMIEGTDMAMFVATNEGVFFRENDYEQWQLFGKGQPHTFVSELKIDYCQAQLLMSTYGRGLWKIPLPTTIEYNNTYSTKDVNYSDSNTTYVLNNNIVLRKKDKLIINSPLYIAKNRKIICYSANQIVLGTKGKIINGCETNYEYIAIKKSRKKVLGIF